MQKIKYEEMVEMLVKPPEEIMKTITPEKIALVHMAMGMAGEGGESVDVIKKHVFGGHDLEMGKIIKELGDLEFYVTGMYQILGISREDVRAANMEKLGERYPEFVCSDQKSVERADQK